MILSPKAFAPCGYILQSHGPRGAIKCEFSPFFTPDFEVDKWFFIAVNDKPVPFLIQSIDYLANDLVIIQLQEITKPETARLYRHHSILYPKNLLNKHDSESMDLIGLDDFEVYNKDNNKIGYIDSVTEYSTQLLLTIQPNDESPSYEAPCHPDLVLGLNRDHKWIKIHLPTGIHNL